MIRNVKTGYGSYVTEAKIPNEIGTAYAFWTFFYNEIYPTDPRYPDYVNEGLHEQGSQEQGFYTVRNHEIDIELPSHLKEGGVLNEPSLNNMKCNTWRGELKNWAVADTDPAYWEEYQDNYVPTGVDVTDGYHEFRIDWHFDRVEFYIDGVLRRTNVNGTKGDTTPDLAGFWTMGIWFPSAALSSEPWLADPAKGWAGGVTDPDGGIKADFETVEMSVRKFSYTPYLTEIADHQRLEAESYPFGGYRVKDVE
jgi:hypothetical protein